MGGADAAARLSTRRPFRLDSLAVLAGFTGPVVGLVMFWLQLRRLPLLPEERRSGWRRLLLAVVGGGATKALVRRYSEIWERSGSVDEFLVIVFGASWIGVCVGLYYWVARAIRPAARREALQRGESEEYASALPLALVLAFCDHAVVMTLVRGVTWLWTHVGPQ